MKQRCLVIALSIMLCLSLFSDIQPIKAASAGCSAASGLSGLLAETTSRSLTQTFSSGEVISVSWVEAPPGSGSPPGATATLAISGAASSSQTGASPLSYGFPTSGSDTVTITAGPIDLTITVSCGTPSPSSGNGGGGFPNPPDGRLNPVADEAYSLWCGNNQLSVYRAPNGAGVQIASVALVSLASLKVGSVISVPTGSGVIVITHPTADEFVVTGPNGNNTSGLSVKTFTLTECLSHNGALPTFTPTFTPRPRPAAYTPSPSATPNTVQFAGQPTNQQIFLAVMQTIKPTNPFGDDDGDRVLNEFDLCPTVSAPGMQFGCPDSDGDGTVDPVDLCPGQPGPVVLHGCPDSDGDGVPDILDLCPGFAPTAAQGNAFGCGDPDMDGFPNVALPNGEHLDWCPMKGLVAGPPLVMGCPDPDGDGLVVGPGVPADLVDNCPTQAGPDSNQGCPLTGVLVVNPGSAASPTPVFTLTDLAALDGSFDNLDLKTEDYSTICSYVASGFCG